MDVLQTLRLLLMHDAQGKYLVIVPALLEVKSDLLAKATGRKLQAVTPQALQRFFRQPGVRRVSGQRKLFESIPLIVDERVTDNSLGVLEASTGMLFDEALTESCLQAAPRARLGMLLDYPPTRGDADTEEISDAIHKFTSKRLSERVEETLSLPTLSPTAQKLMKLRGDPDAGVDDLLPVVSNDPSYSAQAMSWANSPMFAAPGGAHSLDDAVVRILGFDLVVNLGLSLVLGKELNLPVKGPRGAVPYWQRSLATAFLAERLGKQIPVKIRPQKGLVYLSGLLHNFGTLLLGHVFPPQYDQVCEALTLNPHLDAWKVERSVLGVDSPQLAAWLFSYWGLPEELVNAIRWQNQPEKIQDETNLPMLLSLCSRVLREQGMSDGPVTALAPEMFNALGLEFHHVDRVVEDFDELKVKVQDTVSQLKL